MKIQLFSLLSGFLLLSASLPAQLQKIYVHPKAAGTEKQSRFIDSIRLIPLEVKEDIGVKNTNSVLVTRDYFLLTDYALKSVIFYNRDGNFIKKISYRKYGDGFYPAYNEQKNQLVFFGNNKKYTLTPRDRIRIRLNPNSPHNKKYFRKYIIDLNDTSLQLHKAIPEEQDILRSNLLYDDLYWQGQINTSELYKDSLAYEFKLIKNNQVIKEFFPYDPVNEPRFLYAEESVSVIPTENPAVQFITRPFCDTVYKMTSDSLFPVSQLVLPLENSLPPSFFTKAFKNKTERDNFNRNNSMMLHQVFNYYETAQFIFFSIGYLYNYENYIFQKQNNITYRVKNIRSDISQYNLSLLSGLGITRKGNRFYKAQKAGDLQSFFEQHKEIPVPAELENYLKQNPPASAPVIVEFRIKDQS